MLTRYFKSLKDPRLQKSDEIRPGVWTHAEKPTDEELQQLQNDFELDHDLLQDAVDPYEVPRVEIDNNIVYFFTRYVVTTGEETTTMPITIIIGGTFIITITAKTPHFIESFASDTSPVFTTQKTKFFVQLMYAVTEDFTKALTKIRREVRKNRRNLREIKSKDIIRFVSLEDTLNEFISALIPTNTALKVLIKGKHLELFEEDISYVEDLQLANDQVIESARNIEQTIVNIRSTYSTITTHNLNQIIRVLTTLTIILTIPTIISSIFGMNVAIPGSEHPLAFWAILILTTITIVSVVYYFIKKEWI